MTAPTFDENKEALTLLLNELELLHIRKQKLFEAMFEDVTPPTYPEKAKMALQNHAKYQAHACNVGDYLQTRLSIYRRIK
jgi:hypothetical protein